MTGDLVAASVVASELMAALTSMSAHTRRHCDHGGLRPDQCALCATRLTALAALDEAVDAHERLEAVIETMLTALDDFRSEASENCAGCDDLVVAVNGAERRYEVWLDEAAPRAWLHTHL